MMMTTMHSIIDQTRSTTLPNNDDDLDDAYERGDALTCKSDLPMMTTMMT